MRDTIKAYLEADMTLMALLTGGIYAGTEITRQSTPDAFDANGEVEPCALVSAEAEDPTGPYGHSARSFVTVYLYERSGYTNIDAARARIYVLLHRDRVGTSVWDVRHVGDILDQRDPALNCAMAVTRFQVTRLRA